MPLWRVFSHPGVFSPEQRQSFSQAVTKHYASRGLPAFYVNVIFLDTPDGSVYIGGEEKELCAHRDRADRAQDGRQDRGGFEAAAGHDGSHRRENSETVHPFETRARGGAPHLRDAA